MRQTVINTEIKLSDNILNVIKKIKPQSGDLKITISIDSLSKRQKGKIIVDGVLGESIMEDILFSPLDITIIPSSYDSGDMETEMVKTKGSTKEMQKEQKEQNMDFTKPRDYNTNGELDMVAGNPDSPVGSIFMEEVLNTKSVISSPENKTTSESEDLVEQAKLIYNLLQNGNKTEVLERLFPKVVADIESAKEKVGNKIKEKPAMAEIPKKDWIKSASEYKEELTKALSKKSTIDLDLYTNVRQRAEMEERKDMEEGLDKQLLLKLNPAKKVSTLIIPDLNLEMNKGVVTNLSLRSAKKLMASKDLLQAIEEGYISFVSPSEANVVNEEDMGFKAAEKPAQKKKEQDISVKEDESAYKFLKRAKGESYIDTYIENDTISSEITPYEGPVGGFEDIDLGDNFRTEAEELISLAGISDNVDPSEMRNIDLSDIPSPMDRQRMLAAQMGDGSTKAIRRKE